MSWRQNNILRILSAEAGTPPGEGLLAFPATTLVVDESASIPDYRYRNYVLRMLGAKKSTVTKLLVESGTLHKRNHFAECFNDPNYHKIIVDCWKGIEEGRFDRDFIMMQKTKLTPMEFSAWYECKPPDETKNQLNSWALIEDAIAKNFDFIVGKTFLGVDPASTGEDFSVFTVVRQNGSRFKTEEIVSFPKDDPAKTAGFIQELDKKCGFEAINVDANGIGAGVVSVLKERPIAKRVYGVNGSSSPCKDYQDRCHNLKAEINMRLNELLIEGNLSIPKHPKLMDQLSRYEIRFSSREKIVVEWSGEKSPDFGDSLGLACYAGNAKRSQFAYWRPIAV